MKLLADENIEFEIVSALREAGFDVSDIKEINPGIEDDAVLAIAKTTEALLLTYDKDFGELVFRERSATNGVVLLRLKKLPVSRKIRRLLDLFIEHKTELKGSFTVVSLNGLRIRKNI